MLVFLQSKDRARELYHELVYDGIRVDVMHAERTPEQRATLMKRFRTGEVWVLLCTDLLARGLDFKAVNMVCIDPPTHPPTTHSKANRQDKEDKRHTKTPFLIPPTHPPTHPGDQLRPSPISRQLHPPHRPHGPRRPQR